MGACEHAEPIGNDGWKDQDGRPSQEAGNIPVECPCGWEGSVGELHHCGDPDGDCSTMLWCPQCGGSAWVWA